MCSAKGTEQEHSLDEMILFYGVLFIGFYLLFLAFIL